MTKSRCIKCAGFGQTTTGGMMFTECHHCDGTGFVYEVKNSYDEAVSKIKSVNDDLTDEDAQRILDEELEKVECAKRKRKYVKRIDREIIDYGEDCI